MTEPLPGELRSLTLSAWQHLLTAQQASRILLLYHTHPVPVVADNPTDAQNTGPPLPCASFELARTVMNRRAVIFLDLLYELHGCPTPLDAYFATALHEWGPKRCLHQFLCSVSENEDSGLLRSRGSMYDFVARQFLQEMPSFSDMSSQVLLGCLRLMSLTLTMVNLTELSKFLQRLLIPLSTIEPFATAASDALILEMLQSLSLVPVTDEHRKPLVDWLLACKKKGVDELPVNAVASLRIQFYTFLFEPSSAFCNQIKTQELPPNTDLTTLLLAAFFEWATASKQPAILWQGLAHCKLPMLLRAVWQVQGLDVHAAMATLSTQLASLEAADPVDSRRAELLAALRQELDPTKEDNNATKTFNAQEAVEPLLHAPANQIEDALSPLLQDPTRHRDLAAFLRELLATTCTWTDTPAMLARFGELCEVLSAPGYFDIARMYCAVGDLLDPMEQIFHRERGVALYSSALEHFSLVYLTYLSLCLEQNHPPCGVPLPRIVHLSDLSPSDASSVDSWLGALFSDGIQDDLIEATPPFDLVRLAPTIVAQSLYAAEVGLISTDTLKEACSYLSQDMLAFTLPNVLLSIAEQCEIHINNGKRLELYTTLFQGLLGNAKPIVQRILKPTCQALVSKLKLKPAMAAHTSKLEAIAQVSAGEELNLLTPFVVFNKLQSQPLAIETAAASAALRSVLTERQFRELLEV